MQVQVSQGVRMKDLSLKLVWVCVVVLFVNLFVDIAIQQKADARIEALEKRVAALEERLK